MLRELIFLEDIILFVIFRESRFLKVLKVEWFDWYLYSVVGDVKIVIYGIFFSNFYVMDSEVFGKKFIRSDLLLFM